MAFRYEMIKPTESDKLNHLLSKGWNPIRETSVIGSQAELDSPSNAMVLVLFEREGERPLGSGAGNVSLDILSDLPLLVGFTDEELTAFCEACKPCSFQAGELIFREGIESRQLHILLEGEVCIRISGLPLEEMQITDIGPGCTFGESTFFSAAPHTGTAECVQATRTLKLDRDVYDEVIQSGTLWPYKLAENSTEILAANLQATDHWVWELLEQRQNSEVTRSWHRFRERISRRHAEG